ncbi:hypothetical protein [Massilia sp. TS11]|uniref:hypothetical protein n=1 Tax=Massilia sp. TS11 TaxID=2908003 RepID=UPI001EDC45B6|nr:hypothetical protein [Massilia sp. TS11]MCG2583222.1 hypothetical protein [Massilia sp. TS11]
MNVAKHMEAIFLAAVFLVSFTGFAGASVPVLHKHSVVRAVETDAAMPVVVVKAKRLSAAEKVQLGN